MRKGFKIVLLILSIIIVGGGTIFGIIIAATWDEFTDSYTFFYKPEIPNPIEAIKVNTDIGKINIMYNSTPTDYYTKISVDISLKGALVKGKSFSDFFKPIIWNNESTTLVEFSLETKDFFVFFGISRIKINVTLRTDVIYDINAITTTGSINSVFPDNISIDNLELETTTGSIDVIANNFNIINNLNAKVTTGDVDLNFTNSQIGGNVSLDTTTGSLKLYANHVNFTGNLKAITTTGGLLLNFTNCLLGGDLRGKVTTGKLTLRTYNMIYTQDCNWNLDSTTGNVNIFIYQYSNMTSSVIGTTDTSTGNIKVEYEDLSSDIGAFFTASVDTGDIDYHDLGGFSQQLGGFGSDDYFNATAIHTYILDLSTDTGDIDIYGKSI
jgi:hypothetical protein